MVFDVVAKDVCAIEQTATLCDSWHISVEVD